MNARFEGRMSERLGEFRDKLGRDQFVLMPDDVLAERGREIFRPFFDDLEVDLPDVHPNRVRARDVLDYERAADATPSLAEADSVTVVGRFEHPEPREHRRVRLLDVPGLVQHATSLLMLVPPELRASKGQISFDLYRTFGLVTKGRHHDGGETYIAIHCIDHVGGGAVTELSRDAEGEDLVFQKALRPGEVLVVKDDAYLHYTTPLEATNGPCHRDVVIVSIT